MTPIEIRFSPLPSNGHQWLFLSYNPPYAYHLPAGYRFVPTDKEVIDYLIQKHACPEGFQIAGHIQKFHVYHVEPSQLPSKAGGGYWKTGKTDPIFNKEGHKIGKKANLEHYDAQKRKTQWLMKEYRLLNNWSQWAICVVYQSKSKRENRRARSTYQGSNSSMLNFGEESVHCTGSLSFFDASEQNVPTYFENYQRVPASSHVPQSNLNPSNWPLTVQNFPASCSKPHPPAHYDCFPQQPPLPSSELNSWEESVPCTGSLSFFDASEQNVPTYFEEKYQRFPVSSHVPQSNLNPGNWPLTVKNFPASCSEPHPAAHYMIGFPNNPPT
ncbi:hypothetical protein Patl1_14461 [Pistacia atlantica]|uniref:Uncharacterized protein n=1 Tax=Pistacia atlantica TaxID=434234 RepID=A0ACC1AWW8_9ROSI|nr:hypothetical protein Patl1_14461 [Pistacia atlantica]